MYNAPGLEESEFNTHQTTFEQTLAGILDISISSINSEVFENNVLFTISDEDVQDAVNEENFEQIFEDQILHLPEMSEILSKFVFSLKKNTKCSIFFSFLPTQFLLLFFTLFFFAVVVEI